MSRLSGRFTLLRIHASDPEMAIGPERRFLLQRALGHANHFIEVVLSALFLVAQRYQPKAGRSSPSGTPAAWERLTPDQVV